MGRIWCLTGFLAVTGTAIYAAAVARMQPERAPFTMPWWVLAFGFMLTEIYVVHLQFRREAQSYGLSDVPLIVGLYFVAPWGVPLAQAAGAFVALVAHRRQSGVKLAFNVVHMGLSSTVATVVFHAVAAGRPMGPRGWLAALAAVLATNLIADVSIGSAIWLAEGQALRASRLALGALAGIANTSLGLTTVVVLWTYPAAGFALIVLFAIMHAAHRAYASLRAEHERLETLYAATRRVHGSIDLEEIGRTFLSELRTMLRATTAEIVLFDRTEDIAVRTTASGTGAIEIATCEIPDVSGLGGAELISGPPLSGPLAGRGVEEAMLAPLTGKGEVFGTVMVADREGTIRRFNLDDLKQFETAASHAGVSLENAQLVTELRRHVARAEYEARHDALTGLGNRVLLDERLHEALRGDVRPHAVLLLDLDRFKEVNDTLGHRNGDLLLQQLAGRLAGVAGSGATVSRFGGDEFAMLIPIGGNLDAALVAKRVLDALVEPFELEGLSVAVEGSIGIALTPEHGSDAQTLVQRADVAMYIAKQAKSGFEFYDAERDEYSPARLALVAELRDAIESTELAAYFQPKVSIATGRVVGAEALVRWHHPRRGLLSPAEFIPLAEQTGLAAPLTMLVLDQALTAVRGWRDSGRDIGVSVNLPTRLLLDMALPSRVAEALERHHVPPSALTLEVTESSVLEDPTRSAVSLASLEEMGVHISIDDFGTGYSSMSYLRQLPASEIKVDKSFVQGMLTSESDEVIVRTTIDLGRHLGRKVVAEGVENREAWDRLAALGCDVAQGYFLSRPLPAERFAAWLNEWRAPEADPSVRRLVSAG